MLTATAEWNIFYLVVVRIYELPWSFLLLDNRLVGGWPMCCLIHDFIRAWSAILPTKLNPSWVHSDLWADKSWISLRLHWNRRQLLNISLIDSSSRLQNSVCQHEGSTATEQMGKGQGNNLKLNLCLEENEENINTKYIDMGKIGQYQTTTKHSNAWTMNIFLGMYYTKKNELLSSL